ncbi:hypothetical protein M422DRAFT_254527 [Sphaerobolus stellatus SS14]|uniref:Uncharacterized protein n=1 Tax=Sphaerobolus stellatus (strain SS14) TaxID=990650 RepID=A0A0C9UHD8_SPHS4|nr:hypothetical protein M422DRAFT_254527 [Sphaerobolus stellatus SS14]
MYQDIYTVPQAHQQQDTNNNNVGGSENIHNATAAQHGYPNMNVNVNANGVGGGGYQSQIQSPEGVVVGGVGGLGRMGMGGGYGISVEPLLHTLQGLGVGARHDPTHTRHRIHNSPTPSPTHQYNTQPTPDATRKSCPLLSAYTNSDNTNTNSDATCNGTTNNGINTNSHSHNTQSQPHLNSTSPHLQSVPIPSTAQLWSSIATCTT